MPPRAQTSTCPPDQPRAERERSAQLELVVESGRKIARQLDRAAVTSLAVRTLRDLTGADGAGIALIDADGVARIVDQVGLPAELASSWSCPGEVLASYAGIATGRAYRTPELRDAGGTSTEKLVAGGIRAVLGVPLLREGAIYGAMFALRFSAAEFKPDTAQVASLYAAQVSAALENARLYRSVQQSDERFRVLIRSVYDVIAIVSADGTITYASPAVESVWGCAPDELVGTSVLQRVHPDEADGLRGLLERARERPGSTMMGSLRMGQGQLDWRDFDLILTNLLDEPAVSGIVATFHDVTERKTFERELTNMAFRDPLTGLANRALFQERLEHAVRRADREDRSICVLFVDLDNFKVVNDSMGHAWGDEVLRVVGDRIVTCLRAEDTAARLGGDEFTVLMEDITGPEHASAVAERIVSALRAPIRLQGRDVFVGGSLGIAFSTPNLDHHDDLLRKADLAMYRAKSSGKGRVAIFDAGLNQAAVERLDLETGLRRALAEGEFRLHYQPIVTLADGVVREVEALVRWEHPERGLVAPGEFIPMAEETGLIIDLGQWVLEEACRQVRAWQRQFPERPPLVVSVNLSARQFQHSALVSEIAGVLQETGLDPACLTLEITESELMRDAEGTVGKLHALKQLGVQLAIDDFGTGYSSLSYLKQFPVDTLKIDRSFIRGVSGDPHDAAIVRSVVALAAAFGLHVTAEGIETEAQETQLRALGCDRGQGYLFARPLPAAAFEARLLVEATTRSSGRSQRRAA